MLKNIELFDKLSLRFNGRILFIKDISGDEICVWSFYGHQRKVAEICCTSIVYATEKKQTKVFSWQHAPMDLGLVTTVFGRSNPTVVVGVETLLYHCRVFVAKRFCDDFLCWVDFNMQYKY